LLIITLHVGIVDGLCCCVLVLGVNLVIGDGLCLPWCWFNRCISDDAKCPVYPNASHTWGECYANAANKKCTRLTATRTRKGKLKKNEVDSNAAHIGNDDLTIASNVTSLGATDSMSTALAPCCQKAVNNDRTVSTVTDRMCAQLCLDLNNKVNDPEALLALGVSKTLQDPVG
jgi:hypothetical protein